MYEYGGISLKRVDACAILSSQIKTVPVPFIGVPRAGRKDASLRMSFPFLSIIVGPKLKTLMMKASSTLPKFQLSRNRVFSDLPEFGEETPQSHQKRPILNIPSAFPRRQGPHRHQHRAKEVFRGLSRPLPDRFGTVIISNDHQYDMASIFREVAREAQNKDDSLIEREPSIQLEDFIDSRDGQNRDFVRRISSNLSDRGFNTQSHAQFAHEL